MNWETPNLSKKDIQLITVALDEYLNVLNVEVVDRPKLNQLLYRLEYHLDKFS